MPKDRQKQRANKSCKMYSMTAAYVKEVKDLIIHQGYERTNNVLYDGFDNEQLQQGDSLTTAKVLDISVQFLHAHLSKARNERR